MSDQHVKTLSTSVTTGFNIDHMKLFYDRIFPFHLIFQWLSYSANGDPLKFSCREFSMSVARGADEFYMRWQSFENDEAFKKKILSMSPPPHKMDIGAIYSLPVTQKDSAALFMPVEKEIVLDIDMNDYDDIRTCCKDKKVCHKCWRFLAIAMDLLETSLREEFGLRHIFWVFSGRRGVHCWICDPSVRQYSSLYRAALADYLNVISGAANQKKKIQIFGDGDHFMRRAFESNQEMFVKLLEEQDFFHRGSKMEKIVDHYISTCKQAPPKNKTDKTIQEEYELRKEHEWNGSSLGLWKIVCQLCRQFGDKTTAIELMLTFCYPRLDIHVTKDIGHLLKSPFCVHKATGSICIPLPPSERNDFDPTKAPTLSVVREQFLEHQSVDKTDLGRYVKYFEEDVLKPLLNDMNVDNADDSDEDDECYDQFIMKSPKILRAEKGITCDKLDWYDEQKLDW